MSETANSTFAVGPSAQEPARLRRARGDNRSRAHRARRWWLLALAILLLGYAAWGKGWAYIGMPPIFIGEITLGAGLYVMLRYGRPRSLVMLPAGLCLLGLMILCAVRTWPDYFVYHADALRDAVLYLYGLFAIIVLSLLSAEPTLLETLLVWYRRGAKIVLIGAPIFFILYRVTLAQRPSWPWAPGLSLFQQKEGDVLVQLAGVAAFWIAGLGGVVSWGWLLLLACDVAIMGNIDRAGLISFLAVLGAGTILRPRSSIPWRVLGVLLLPVIFLAATGIEIEVPGGKGRTISFEQLTTNFDSLTADTGDEAIDSTKEWRMEWWHEIVHYTIYGKYFWTGKGFGVNLADDDGFQVLSSDTLRAPHSAHMDFLARAGVPGLGAWALTQLVWAGGMFGCYLRSRRFRQRHWESLFLFLGLFWLAALINSSFDVYLEGPMGGIWFWTIFGGGMAAMWIYRQRPEALSPDILSATRAPPKRAGSRHSTETPANGMSRRPHNGAAAS